MQNLEVLDLVWALGLVAMATGLAQWQKLGISGQIAIASARSIIQLLVMGFGLQIVWQLDQPLVTMGVILVLAIGTTIAASNRISDRVNLHPVVGGAILAGLTVALGYTILFVIKPTN